MSRLFGIWLPVALGFAVAAAVGVIPATPDPVPNRPKSDLTTADARDPLTPGWSEVRLVDPLWHGRGAAVIATGYEQFLGRPQAQGDRPNPAAGSRFRAEYGRLTDRTDAVSLKARPERTTRPLRRLAAEPGDVLASSVITLGVITWSMEEGRRFQPSVRELFRERPTIGHHEPPGSSEAWEPLSAARFAMKPAVTRLRWPDRARCD